MLQTDPSVFASTAFHYLIVGGGPAGLTLAARLSEDPEIQVGLIEAGQFVHGMPQIDVPGYCGQLNGNPDFDWMMSTVPQKSLNDRAVFQPRGKVLGGCTAINFTLVTRATESEYNALEELGNDGWNWSEILNYLKRSETITMPSKEDAHKYAISPEADYHGTDGPVQKISPRWFPDIHAHFMETMSTLGLKVNHEPQNGSNVGVFTGAYTIDPKTVTRSYATSAHFTPNMQRRNLHVLIAAEATKVLTRVDADVVVATGVEFQHSGTSYTAMATREVILCTGSLKTPQLLELSGIGNSAIINPLGISAVVDLPGVGENLQDHPGVPVIQEVKPDTQTFEILQDPAILGEQVALYAAEKKGMLSSIYPSFSLLPLRSFVEEAQATNLVKTVDDIDDDGKHIALFKKWFDDPQQAQIEIIGCPSWMPIGQPGEVSPNPGSRYVSFVVILMHPFSRGSVHIASADPLAAPAIDPKYLSNPVDVELFVQAVKFARKAMLTPPVGQYHLKYVQPGPEVDSDEEIRQWLLKYVGTMWHPLGTASMLPKEDGGVVNSKLVVYGTKNLRVVDASIIPLQLSCHLQATVYAIAEKAADIIKKAYA